MGRGRPPGSPRTGGRQPGTQNRVNGAMLDEIRAKCPDWNPVMWMSQIARTGKMPTVDPETGEVTYISVNTEIRIRAGSESASYLYPKLKAVEVTDGNQERPEETAKIEIVIKDASK